MLNYFSYYFLCGNRKQFIDRLFFCSGRATNHVAARGGKDGDNGTQMRYHTLDIAFSLVSSTVVPKKTWVLPRREGGHHFESCCIATHPPALLSTHDLWRDGRQNRFLLLEPRHKCGEGGTIPSQQNFDAGWMGAVCMH